MTVDGVMADLRDRYGAEIQAAIDWQAVDGGEVHFTVGIDRLPKIQLDDEAKAEEMKAENLLARIKALETAK